MIKNLTLGLCVLMLAACATPTPSAGSVETAIAQTQTASAASTAAFVAAHGACAVDAVLKMSDTMHELLTRWDDASQLANSTPRASLSPQIAALQSLRREATGLDAPDCLQVAKQNMVDGMNDTVQAFIDFLGQQPDDTVNTDFSNAKTAFGKFDSELARVHNCAPTCS